MPDWFDTFRPVVAGIVAAIAVGFLARFGFRSQPDRTGWRHIRPGGMHWFGLIGCAAFAALALYVRLFVGSARVDAEEQMKWAELLAAGMSLGTLVSLWQISRIHRAAIHWRGATLRYNDATGVQRTRPMNEVAGMRSRWTGTVELAFKDGTSLLLDQYAKGVPELCEQLAEFATQAD